MRGYQPDGTLEVVKTHSFITPYNLVIQTEHGGSVIAVAGTAIGFSMFTADNHGYALALRALADAIEAVK